MPDFFKSRSVNKYVQCSATVWQLFGDESKAEHDFMKRPASVMLYSVLCVWLLAVLTLAVIAAPAAQPASGDTASVLESIRKKHDLPALAVVVVKDGRICDRAAVGIRKWGDPAPVTTNDVFHIGSCTKSMTATLTAMLIEEGKLRWDTTIAEVFPEWKGKMDKQYEAVTVEQLLKHRGGVPGAAPAAAWKRAWEKAGTPVEQRREFIEAVLRQPPEAAPGTKMIYSNQDYAIVGAMLEKLTGQAWEDLISERLFKPLHMDSAGFGPPGTTGAVDQPWGHTRKLFITLPLQEDNPPAISPAGRVHCSLDDLARFTIFHMRRNQTGGLLKPETLVKLHTPPEGGDYACGWVVVKRGWAGGNALMHNGSNTMWYVVMWLGPEKNFSVVVGTNIAGTDAEQGCDEVAAAMIHHWLAQ
jgi:CubicO group peptidase (beta-lactamase class C family)